MSAVRRKKEVLIHEHQYGENDYARYSASRNPHSDWIVLSDEGGEVFIHTEALHELVCALYEFRKKSDEQDRKLIAKTKKKMRAA